MSKIFLHPGILLGAALLISLFYGTWAVPLFDLDEGAFTEASREMLERHDFISTYLNGAPRYDKPILIYWLQAASVTLFGLNEFALRLPSSLAASIWVLALFFFMRRVTDEVTALYAGLVAALSVAVTVIGKAATADALLNMLLAMSMFSLYLYIIERKLRWLLGVYALTALGFLAKGPVAILVPGAVSLLFFAWKREWRIWLRMVLHPIGIPLFLLIALPWYVLQYLHEGQAFIDGFFFKHNLDRFQGPMEQHGGSVFYYVPVVLIGVLPFTSAGLRALSLLRTFREDDLKLFAALWFMFVLVFFSFSGTKLPHYVNYGLSGLFILSALYLDAVRNRFWALLPALLLTGLLIFIPELIAAQLHSVKDPFIRDALIAYPQVFGAGYRGYFIVVLAVLMALLIDRRLRIETKLVASGFLLVIGINTLLLPAVGELLQAPVKHAALLAREQKLPVKMWRINTPSFSVYRQAVTPKTDTVAPGDVIFTKKDQLPELPAHELLYVGGGAALVRILERHP